jgi:excisionase family DNA binding protein
LNGLGEFRLLTVPELAQALAVSTRRVYALVEAGKVPFLRLGGQRRGSLRFDLTKVLAALEAAGSRSEAAS